ncbi:hypothetical protein HYN48_13750 [Flavobacterium magnum]|uniref:HEAT repeat domain-containing protein n=1 Tax=Flavobacterium magnum TaxID=2162713 RepID=A0A2S0RH38_9FLAO|nr:hypothetical protein [Flavobacterium magnum]AWA31063.1 hypothetical protein HYN48_13750 [Flavobacterium magnum]
MNYEDTPDYNKAENDILLNSSNEDEKILALITLVHCSGNYNLAMQKSIEFAKNESELIAANAIGCFGDIARIYRKLDFEIVEEILNVYKNSQSEWIHSKILDSLDDILVFLKNDRLEIYRK